MVTTLLKTQRSPSIQLVNVAFETSWLNRAIKQNLMAGLAVVCTSLVGYGAELALEKQPGGDNTAAGDQEEKGLIGYWKLKGDCRDHSGHGNHGLNYGVNLDSGAFDGIKAHIEVPSSPSLKFGTGDFTLSAWIYTEKELDDVLGDVLDLYDPSLRRGITLSVYSSGSGYQGPGNDRHVCFGIDNARLSD